MTTSNEEWIRVKALRIDHDVPNDLCRRHGYSVCINGYWLVDFEPCLIVALCKAWYRWRKQDLRRDR